MAQTVDVNVALCAQPDPSRVPVCSKLLCKFRPPPPLQVVDCLLQQCKDLKFNKETKWQGSAVLLQPFYIHTHAHTHTHILSHTHAHSHTHTHLAQLLDSKIILQLHQLTSVSCAAVPFIRAVSAVIVHVTDVAGWDAPLVVTRELVRWAGGVDWKQDNNQSNHTQGGGYFCHCFSHVTLHF